MDWCWVDSVQWVNKRGRKENIEMVNKWPFISICNLPRHSWPPAVFMGVLENSMNILMSPFESLSSWHGGWRSMLLSPTPLRARSGHTFILILTHRNKTPRSSELGWLPLITSAVRASSVLAVWHCDTMTHHQIITPPQVGSILLSSNWLLLIWLLIINNYFK